MTVLVAAQSVLQDEQRLYLIMEGLAKDQVSLFAPNERWELISPTEKSPLVLHLQGGGEAYLGALIQLRTTTSSARSPAFFYPVGTPFTRCAFYPGESLYQPSPNVASREAESQHRSGRGNEGVDSPIAYPNPCKGESESPNRIAEPPTSKMSFLRRTFELSWRTQKERKGLTRPC